MGENAPLLLVPSSNDTWILESLGYDFTRNALPSKIFPTTMTSEGEATNKPNFLDT
jgi:hypothetical protein